MVLVGTSAEQERPPEFQMESSKEAHAVPMPPDLHLALNNGEVVLNMAAAEFGEFFQFSDVVHVMDVRLSQSRGMKGLRSLLGMLREQVLKVCKAWGLVRSVNMLSVHTCTNTYICTCTCARTHTHTHTHTSTAPTLGFPYGIYTLTSDCPLATRHASRDDLESLLSEDKKSH